MRTRVPTLLPLFRSEFQVRLLALLLLPPRRPRTAGELQEALGATPASVHRELQRALAAGIIRREEVGRTFHYSAADDSPILAPLTELLERTVGIEADLRQLLEPLSGVEAAAIYGSFARRDRAKPDSDIDVVLIGEVDLSSLRTRLRRLERKIGRQIDAVAYTPAEFRDMLGKGNSFARSIQRGPLTPLVGDIERAIAA